MNLKIKIKKNSNDWFLNHKSVSILFKTKQNKTLKKKGHGHLGELAS